MQVGIYIETNNAIQRKQLHRYGYVMESEYQGRTITAEGFGKADETFHGTILMALNDAVQRLLGKCELFVYAQDPYIMQALVNQVPEWQRSGWIRANGDPVKHADIWKQITGKLDQLGITQIGTDTKNHQYSSWIKSEIKRMEMNE